jgi:hypothetical protein
MPAGFEDDDLFDESPTPRDEASADPKQRATDVIDQLRIYCELAAVFEGPRKFDAFVRTNLDAKLARDVQQTVGTLEKQKSPRTGPILPAEAVEAAQKLLELPQHQPSLTTNDYHVLPRPGEAMIVRWLVGDEVDRFYDRFTAHITTALAQRVEDERQELGWRQDEADQAYLAKLEEIEPKPEEWYLREILRKHGLFALSTVAVDEMDIMHLCDTLMGIPAADVVGEASAPDPDEADPPHAERAWYFKLFNLRGIVGGVERMCLFAYLQRTSDELW